MRRVRGSGWGVFVVALLVAACQGPVAGNVTFNLTTPNGDDGAVAFRVISQGGTTLTGASPACAGCRLFVVAVADTELRAIVTGDIAAGPLVDVMVSDLGKPSDYTASVLGVASRSFAVRESAPYALAPATK